MMKKIFRAVLCAALVLMMIPGPACAETAPAEKKVTVMVYMCGADLELMSRGTSTISEMYSARFSQDDINVIALCGGTRKWACGLDANVLSVVDVGKGGRRSVSVAEELPLASMGQPETLANFLALCKEKYPAERYDLVLWDHGGGPVGGVCWDAKFGEDQLTTAEVAAGLAASPFADRGLDLILMHACLMASAEFAFQVAPYAKYYVASQDSQFGLTYDWLKGMESEDSLETAKKVVDGSFESNTATIERQAASEVNSFAVIDLTKMQALRDAVNDFFAVLPAQMDVEELTVMSRQRRDSQAFGLGESGGDSDFDLVDLGDLIRHCADIAPEKAEVVLAAIGEAVVYRRSVNENCSGLTIFHPYRNKKYAAKRMEIYETLSFPESYTGYLRQFMAYLNDNPKANWVGLETETPAATKDARTGFILPLTEEQAGQYADSALVGLEKTGEDSYSFRYLSRSTSLEGATVTGEYVRNGVYPAGADGALAEAVTYDLGEDGSWWIAATLTKAATEENEEAVHEALIRFTYDRETRKLIPGAVLVKDTGTGGYTGAYGTAFADYDEIRITYVSRKETTDANGTLLPFSEWEEAETREWTGKIDGSWDFTVIPENIEASRLYAAFEITDLQSNRYLSRLIPLERETIDPVTRFDYDDAGLLTLSRPTVSMLGGQMAMSMTVTNLRAEECTVTLKNLVLNEKAMTQTATAYGNGENWGLLQDEEQNLALMVPGTELPEGILTEAAFDMVLEDAKTGETVGTVPVTVGLNLDPSAQ